MTVRPSISPADPSVNAGLVAAILAFVMWGLFPVYFKLTDAIGPLEILAHRVIWSVFFGAIVIQFRKQWPQVRAALVNFNTLKFLLLATLCIAVNWGTYIWAVQNDQIFQASLGYYINPLIFVAIGTVVLNEHLSRLKFYAISLAAIGVAVLTFYGGQFPWVALTLALSWTAYAVIRKQINVGAMPGLFVETICLLLPAIAYLAYLAHQGTLAFLNFDLQMDVLLVLAGPISVLPLLAFTFAARRLTLVTVGFLQFIGPTLQFSMGLLYGEILTTAHMICFALIWIAVSIFVLDGWRASRRPLA